MEDVLGKVQRIDVVELLRVLALKAEKTGDRWVAKCPNPAHPDTKPSWSMIDKPGHKKHGSHHCFACKFNGGPWELAAAVWGVELKEAGKRLGKLLRAKEEPIPKKSPDVVIIDSSTSKADPFSLPLGVVIPGPGGRWFEMAERYVLDRGVTRDQLDRWGAGYAIRGHLALRVVFPVYDGAGNLHTYSARAISPGAKGGRYETGSVKDGANPRRAIWGEAGFRGNDTVTIAEGVFSALSLERAGAPNPCAMLGSELTEEKSRVFSRFRRILVATDPDDAGNKVARAISILGRHVLVTRVDLPASPDDMEVDGLREKIDVALRRLC